MVSPVSGSATTPVDPTGDYRIDALLYGSKWGGAAGSGTDLTFSFPGIGSTWADGYGTGEPSSPSWRALDATEQAWFRSALSVWAEVANVHFTEVADTATDVGDIRVAYSALGPAELAWTYYPAPIAEAGDVWLDINDNWSFGLGSSSYATLIHEIGHALGLKHSFSGTTTLPSSQNSYQYSIMSYTPHPGVDIDPITPMLYDILAIQHLYGANYQTRADDTVYTSDPTALRLRTIWDGGGNDTFDLSAHTAPVTVSLRAGSFSSIGLNPDGSHAQNNIAIAFGVVIENAIGGSGDDHLIGNTAANSLEGSAGNDTLTGGGGNDWLSGGSGGDMLDGGIGDDTMIGGAGDDLYRVDQGGDVISEQPGLGFDRVDSLISYTLPTNVEELVLTGTADTDGTGNSLDNRITGNAGNNILAGSAGNDTLSGGRGDDALRGDAGDDSLNGNDGTDTLTGGDGADTLQGGPGNDWLSGGADADSLNAGTGNDTLYGGTGDDILRGGGGDDQLDGGGGADRLIGGAGADTYIFRALDDGIAEVTTVVGYTKAENDILDLLRDLGVVHEELVGGVWQLTLAGDGDVIRLEGTADTGTTGTILDDILVI